MNTDTTRPQPTADGPFEPALREHLHAALVVALALAAALGAAGAVAAQEGSTVEITDASVDPGGTSTARVVLTSAPAGLAGYELVLSVGDGEVAAIAGANYTRAFGLTTDSEVSDDGRTVRLEAADVDGGVESGATGVTLATVELRGVSVGETDIEVRPVQFDADGGARTNASADAGTVTVGEPTPTAAATDEATAAGGSAEGDSGAATADATDEDEDEVAAGRTERGTSDQTGLPLAGVGVAALALALAAAMIARRR